MAGLPGRRYATAATALALVSLCGGSWLVVSAAGAGTGPPPVPSASASPRARDPGRAAAGAVAPSSDVAAPIEGDASAPSGGPSAGDDPPGTTTGNVPGGPAAPAGTTTSPGTTPTTPPTTPALPPPTTTAPAPPPLTAAALVPGGGPNRHATGSAPPVSITESQAARQLIAAIGTQSGGRVRVPATPDNVTLLARWVANEGGLWANNPLNTSLYSGEYPHEITASGQNTGDPIFPSMAVGIAATATTLLTNPAYDEILAGLRSGHESCLSFARAVIRSPWAASHYEHSTARFCGGASSPAPVTHPRHRRG